jgi:hypothetical protein
MRATVIAVQSFLRKTFIAPRSEGGGHGTDDVVAMIERRKWRRSAIQAEAERWQLYGGSNSAEAVVAIRSNNSGGSSGGTRREQRWQFRPRPIQAEAARPFREQRRPFSGGRAARRSHRGSHNSLRRSSWSIGSLTTRSACRLWTTLFSSYHRKVKHRQVSATAYSTRNRP